MKELELENERLRKKNRKLRVQNIQISKKAYKWYQQNRTLKTKYQILKVLHAAQVSVDASSQIGEMSEDYSSRATTILCMGIYRFSFGDTLYA